MPEVPSIEQHNHLIQEIESLQQSIAGLRNDLAGHEHEGSPPPPPPPDEPPPDDPPPPPPPPPPPVTSMAPSYWARLSEFHRVPSNAEFVTAVAFPGDAIRHLNAASDNGFKLQIIPATVAQYKRNGVFDLSLALQIIGNYPVVSGHPAFHSFLPIDEPHSEKSWGKKLSKSEIEAMGQAFKDRQGRNTLVYVRSAPQQLPEGIYANIDGPWVQWSFVKGFEYGPRRWLGMDYYVNKCLGAAQARGFKRELVIWGLALQHGGIPSTVDEMRSVYGDGGTQALLNSFWSEGMPRLSPSHTGSSQGQVFMRKQEIEWWLEATKDVGGLSQSVFHHSYGGVQDWGMVRDPERQLVESLGGGQDGPSPVPSPTAVLRVGADNLDGMTISAPINIYLDGYSGSGPVRFTDSAGYSHTEHAAPWEYQGGTHVRFAPGTYTVQAEADSQIVASATFTAT